MAEEFTQDTGVQDSGAGAGAGQVESGGQGGASPSIDYPSSWREQDRQHWDSTPEDVRKIIAAREANWAKESQQYKQAHENWSKYNPLIQRYDGLFRDEGVSPDQGIANMLQLAHNLRYGDEATKAKILESLQGFYGKKQEAAREYMDPEVGQVRSELEQRLNEVTQALQAQQQQFRGYVEEGTRREIETFAKNPEHKHFNRLATTMGKMINSGLANDMDQAYDMSLKLHPDLIEKAQIEQSRNQQQSDIKKSQSRQALQDASVNVRGNGRAPAGTKPQASLRKTLESAYDKMASRQ